MFSKYLGDEDMRLKQRSRGHSGGRGSANTSEQNRTRKLVDANQFLTQPEGTCVVVTPGLADGRRASLPVRVSVKISDRERHRVERAAMLFERRLTRTRASKSSMGVSEAELRERYEEANRFLPLSPQTAREERAEKRPAPDDPRVTAILAQHEFFPNRQQ
ncbi:MAG: hypothetical protein AAFX40_14645, partial [Cyanobacteria bacterium J06639_1]